MQLSGKYFLLCI